MLKLASATDPLWAARAARRLEPLLLDHAHLEKKAAGMAVTLLFRYPQHSAFQQPLSALAREELGHFEEVLRHLARYGVAFGPLPASPYAGRLRGAIRGGEPERLLDTLLCSALIEARSCERLGLLADALPDPELARFYRGLRAAEARHYAVYLELACGVAPREEVAERLETLAHHEARVLAEAPDLPRLHAGAAP